MAGMLYKRCSCTEIVEGPDGTPRRRHVGRKCPALVRKDGSWDSRHGSWGFHLQVPVPAGVKRCQLSQFGHATRVSAAHVLGEVQELLAVAQHADEPAEARVEIAEMIRMSLRERQALPEATYLRRKVCLGQPVSSELTVETFLREWIAGKNDLKSNTRRSYLQQVDGYLVPLLGRYRLDRLRVAHLQAAFDEITEQAETIVQENEARRRVLAASKRAWRKHNAPEARAARARLKQMPAFRRPAGPATILRIRATLRAALTDA